MEIILCGLATAEEPPTISPFGEKETRRDDALPGIVELSDGTIHSGMIHLTRDKRLQIYDAELQRQREIPLSAVKQIDCAVKREWMEKEWKFKETTTDEKIYTGRAYPAREYSHTITLNDGRKINGPLAALLYLKPTGTAADADTPDKRFILHKRDKGGVGEELKSLVYVKRITFGKTAMEGTEK